MPRRDQINVRFPKELILQMERLVEKGRFMNRQELIREAVRRLLEQLERESYTGP